MGSISHSELWGKQIKIIGTEFRRISVSKKEKDHFKTREDGPEGENAGWAQRMKEGWF